MTTMTDHERMNYWRRRARSTEAERRDEWRQAVKERDQRIADEKALRMRAVAAATEAEAQIEAVRDVLDGRSYKGAWTGNLQVRADLIRYALDGDA